MQKKLKILIQVLFFLVLTATMSQKTYAAEVLFNPANSSFSANSSQTVNLQVNTSNVGVGGFTLFIDITGTIPSNLSFTPASVTGLDLWANTLTDITGGKRLSFSMNVPLGGNPYTNNTNVVMGTFNFTMPASGNFIMTVANSSEVVHATNYTNLLSNFRTSTYTVTTTPTNTPIPTPTNTIAPTATPTSTPAPTATLTPMPSVTQSPTFGSVDVSFRLEGVLSTIPTQAITFSLLNPDSDAPLMNPINQNIAPAANGTFTATLANVPSGLVKVCVKGTSHLRRCTRPATTVNPRFARHVTVPAGGSVALDLASDDLNHLRAGDVNNSNTITQEDSQSILNIFTTGGTGVFAVPVAANTPQDINRDGYVSIVDIALNSINFDDFIIAGD